MSEILDPDMPTETLKLHLGELTASEIRVARAAIGWANSAMRELDVAIKISVSMADNLHELNLSNYNEDDVGQLNHDAANLASAIYQIEKAHRASLSGINKGDKDANNA